MGGLYLSANGVSLTDCTSVFSGIFHIDHSLELDGKIVQYFKTAGPWEMRVPQHELLKCRETVQKSQHEPAHGEGGVSWREPSSPLEVSHMWQNSSKQQLSDGMRCRDSHTLYPQGSPFIQPLALSPNDPTELAWNNKEQESDAVEASYL